MDYRRIFDLFPYQEARFPNKTALAVKGPIQWKKYSTKECTYLIDQVSAGLLNLGLQRGDSIAIISPIGEPFWNFLDFGAQQIGVVVVPIHATITDDHLLFILSDAEVSYCFTANRELYQRVFRLRSQLIGLKQVFSFHSLPDLPSLEQLLIAPEPEHLEYLQTYKAAIHEDDLATIIYTSGTTGTPKGVMLSHKNIISNIKSVIAVIPVNCDKRVISFLPLSHVFERMAVYTYIAVGASIYYAENQDRIFANIKEVRPHYFTTVPLILERFYEQIILSAVQGSNWREDWIKWAVKLGKKYNGRYRIAPWYWIKLLFADLTVFRYWRRLLGGKVEGIVVGAAAMRTELSRLFSAAGIEIREGYGLTETSPVISLNRFEPGGQAFNTVGKPIPGVQVRIQKEEEEQSGEIQVKGPNVMLGYHRQEKLTQSVFTEDGWFRTGDLGVLDKKRFLKITGRKNELFKTASGKFINPEEIETSLRDNAYISQCIILGDQQPFVSALIIPNFNLLQRWCQEHKVHWTAPQFMVLNTRVVQFFKQEIALVNEALLPYQRIRAFELLHTPWSVESEELTPTLKPIRKVIIENNRKRIDQIYA